MSLLARTFTSDADDSHDVGRRLGERMMADGGGAELPVIVAYATVNHEHATLTQGVRGACGRQVAIIGCSTQGIMARDFMGEDGYLVGGVGLGGQRVRTATACSLEIPRATREKGAALGRELVAGLGETPRV